ncbi:MAG: hypothetical protein VX619_00940 [bacterium]|nr:hypothetical protein [bacterium]
MAIRWLKDIGIIKRVLAEAETSARLVAIRSLELMLNSDALRVLEESHANAISFEKFFIEKAINNIKEYQDSGVMPVEIQKALEKQEKLSEDSVKFKSFAVENDYGQEPVEIGDLSTALSSHRSQEPEKELENAQGSDSDSNQYDSSSKLIDSSLTSTDTVTKSVTNEQDFNSSNLEKSSELVQNLPSQSFGFDESDSGGMNSEDSSSSSESFNNQNLLEEEKSSLNEAEIIDDLLPLNKQSEKIDEYEDNDSYDDLLPSLNSSQDTISDSYDDLLPSLNSPQDNISDSYDDLLPSLNSSQDSISESYDDLLPPLNASKSDREDMDSFDSLLPPLDSTNSNVIDNFDDLLPSSISDSTLNSEDDYKDLLPPENSDSLLELQVDNSDQNIDYDDLLPPLDNVHGTESNEYDDLLPPLDVSTTEYDDLLPKMSSDASAEDLIPSLNKDVDDEENLTTNYDDLLPPLK